VAEKVAAGAAVPMVVAAAVEGAGDPAFRMLSRLR